MLAYYFPPMGMGGVQRAAKFVKYLPAFGWEPVVVTVKETAYFAKDWSLTNEVAQAQVERTGSLDPQRLVYLAKRRYHGPSAGGRASIAVLWRRYDRLARWLFVPDAKILWVPFAFLRAWRLMTRERVHVLVTTSPPPSAHLAGFFLRALRGCRWLADFRDQWTGGHLDVSPTGLHRALNRCLERLVLRHADRVVCVSHALAASLRRKSRRHDVVPAVIPNGYDEEDFYPQPRTAGQARQLVYCGSLGRLADPSNYLNACAAVMRRHHLGAPDLRLVFVGATVDVDLYGLVSGLGLQEVVEVTGYVEHRTAVERLQSADVLVLLLTGTTSQDVVPGKVFEYLRAGKPILAVAPPGETIELLRSHAPHAAVCQDTPEAIEQALEELLFHPLRVHKAGGTSLLQFERRHLAQQFAQVLDSLHSRDADATAREG